MTWAPSPRVLDLRSDPDADLTPVVDHLREGRPIAYPTETVYGLGGACSPEGVQRVREIKRRSEVKPLIVLVRSAADASGLAWTDAARELAEVFWPGALTLVLGDPHRLYPEGVRHPLTGSVGIRVSPHPVAARLVQAAGALTSTSLNESGEPPARAGHEALGLVRKLGADDVWVLDAGTLPPSRPSTVVDCTAAPPVVLRAGAVPIGRIRCILPEIHERTI
jgi:L-threonylcarbamoyladenylate synthase